MALALAGEIEGGQPPLERTRCNLEDVGRKVMGSNPGTSVRLKRCNNYQFECDLISRNGRVRGWSKMKKAAFGEYFFQRMCHQQEKGGLQKR